MKTIRVKVRPNARQSLLVAQDDGSWLAQLKAPPVDGQANDELVALLARQFDLPRAQVRIRSGASARVKLVRIG